jgi:putative transposase
VNVAVDALGNPVRIVLSEGQAADVIAAPLLLEGFDFGALIADKGYDADWLCDLVADVHHADVVIPPRRNRTDQREYDRQLYKFRNLVERFFNWAKHFRRVATRYEKTARNFLSFWNFAAMMNLLR